MLFLWNLIHYVTGAPVHATIQINIMYAHMVRRSIYKTRWSELFHSPIRQYNRRPQGPASHTCYMESLLYTARPYATSTSTSTSTFPEFPTPLQSPRACLRVKILPIAASYSNPRALSLA